MSDKEEGANSGSDGSNEKTPETTTPDTTTMTTTNDDTTQNNPEPAPDTPDANSTVINEEDNNKAPLTPTAVKEKKIEVLLKATGDAPIMAKKKWVVSPEQTVGWISGFIKRAIKLGAEERLFLYINQTFAPAPDQTVKNLYECYGTDGKLIIHYCRSQAWG